MPQLFNCTTKEYKELFARGFGGRNISINLLFLFFA
jgi:hypothetical protein